jgi:inner membrane transporter RhtA
MPKNSTKPFMALMILSIAIIMFQSGSAFAVAVFATIGPMATVALRQGSSALLMGAFAKVWKIDFQNLDLKSLIPYGLSLGIMNICFYLSISRIPLGVAVSIEFAGPLLVGVFASRKKSDLLWVLIAAIGIYLLLPLHQFSQHLDRLGLFYAAIAGAAWAGYIVFGHNIGKTMNETQSVAIGMIICAAISIPLAIFVGVKQNIDLWHWIMYGAMLTFFSGAVPYTMEMYAMKRMSKSTISLIMSLDPAFAAISGFVFLHQKLHFMQIIAVLLIIIASLGATFTSSKTPPNTEPLI